MKKEKMNNKGFSLVELIIVIAIMAVLVVVLAPQYLKYVERSRNSTDTSNATSIVTALQVWAADPDAGDDSTTAFKSGDTFTITIAAGGGSKDASATAAVDDALNEAAITLGDIKCKSKSAWDSYIIKGTVQTNGSIKFIYSSKIGSNPASPDEFATRMQ